MNHERTTQRSVLRHSWTGAAIFLLVLQVGCASSGTPDRARSKTDVTAPGVRSTVNAPAEIMSLDAVETAAGVDIGVEADRALVWTTYRDAQGNLVVELPNSVPGRGLSTLSRTTGLVSSVDVERLEDAERPLTRLVIRTREETEHALTTEGERLRLQLVPVGYDVPTRLAYEPMPESTEPPLETANLAPDSGPQVEVSNLEDAADDTGSSEMGEHASHGTQGPPKYGSPDYGTPDAPKQGPLVSGVMASQLLGVELAEADGATVIRILGDGEFDYTTFRLESPERFVIDLDGVVNTSLRSTVPVDDATVDQVRIGQFKPQPDPVSRVVFDLRDFAPPHIERGPDGLTITFGGPPPPPAPTLAETVSSDELPATEWEEPAPAPPVVVAEAPRPAEPVFEHGADEPFYDAGEAIATETIEPEPTVVAAVPEPPPVPQVPVYQPAESEIVAEAPSVVPMPPPTVAPMPTPTVAPMPTPEAPPIAEDDVAMYEARQVQRSPPPAGQTEDKPIIPPSFQSLVVSSQQQTYVGEPITMSLKNADLVETLRSFARISDLNFVIQPGVSGNVTVELNGVPWDQALEQILKINNLGMDIDGTIVRIAPLPQLQSEAEARRRLAEERKRTVPLTTVIRRLSYASAGDVQALLESRSTSGGRGNVARGSILSSRGSTQVDQRTNTLIIRELPETISTVLSVIDNLDIPEPQVRIEARIIEATKSFSRSLGVQWNFTGEASPRLGNTTGIEFPNNVQAAGGVNLLTGGNNGFLNLSLGNVLNSFTLDTTLLAAESNGLVNVVSAPSVLVLNNEQASIQSGIQIPVQTVANNTVTVQYVNATLQLSVTPQITAEGTILMSINVAKKEPQFALALPEASSAPISTREASTRVIVRDGGTAVVGGIYEVSNNQGQSRVPGLANVPILGHLFRNRSRGNQNQELLIFVTPRIVQL